MRRGLSSIAFCILIFLWLKDLSTKFEDQDYLDGLSPEAQEEMNIKYKTLHEDLSKYQQQLYQILNQANYFFMQKMISNISKASEKIAKDKKIDLIINKEACFYNEEKMDITNLVIEDMNKNFDKENSEKEAALNEEKN